MEKNTSLVASLKKILKENNRLWFHGHAKSFRESYSDDFVFELNARKESYSSGGPITTIEVPGRVGNGNTDATEILRSTIDGSTWLAYSKAFRPVKGYWSLFAHEEVFRSAIESLPNDAELRLEVLLDHGTNQICVDHGLHVDMIFLHAKWQRGKRTINRKFMIDCATGRHNTARFGVYSGE